MSYQKIRTVNIGGGMPIDYHKGVDVYKYDDYVNLIKSSIPELFSSDFTICTEFGRSIIAKSGILLSKVEYVKEVNKNNIIMNHVGINEIFLLLRIKFNAKKCVFTTTMELCIFFIG